MRWVKVAFIILFGLSYVVAFQHQVAHLKTVRPSHLAALHRLAHSTNLSLTISDHFLDYTWREDDNKENNAARFAKKVEFIRSHGGIQYLPWNQKQAFRKQGTQKRPEKFHRSRIVSASREPLIALWYLKQENGRAHPLQRQPGELLHCRGRQLAGAPVVVLN